jgi:phosphoribosyl 1,2-cyclic phosphodiesterase
MGIHLHVLGTSSSGNCALIETPRTRILLDAGFSGRRIEGMLRELGKPIESVEAVLITHEHGDHASGITGLARHRHLKFFANYATAQVLQRKASRSLQWMLFETGSTFALADLMVETFLLPHDAMEPVGFVFRKEGSDLFDPPASLAWVTDLGHIPHGLAERVREVQILVLEANHDPELLENDTKRPFSVKQRIVGRHGHLSNMSARAFLESVESPRWRRVLLAHLSKDCNHPDRVLEAMGNGHCPWPVTCLPPDQLLFPAINCGAH